MGRPKISGLTPSREKVLRFIRAYVKIHGVNPTYATIAKGIGFSSKASVCVLVHRLKEEGFLEVAPKKYRGIKVVDKRVKEVLAL